MGKASSNKKAARAAKAGGGRARAAGERNIVFPMALLAVVVLGTSLVVYARENRSAEALEPPLAFEDHWHSAYGLYVCDEFLAPLPEYVAPQNGGNHTHGDGLIHIHPFSPARAGENATLARWLSDAGTVLGGGDDITEDRLGIPGRETYVEGEDSCPGDEGEPIVQVALWESAQDAIDGEDPAIITRDFDDIRFARDGQAYVLAFAPEGTEIPPPPSVQSLSDVGSDLGVPEEEIPHDAELDEDFGDAEGAPSDDAATDDAPSEDAPADDSSTTPTTADDEQ